MLRCLKLSTTTKDGRQWLSLWASKLFEKSGIRQLFGVNLLAAVIITGVVTPQIDPLLSQKNVEMSVTNTPLSAPVHTQTTLEMPLVDFRLSQYFSWHHPGIDMTAPVGTPVYAVDAGFVKAVEYSFLGYGKNVYIMHENNLKSHYAHLSEIRVTIGQQIERGEMIGKVGSTGWSTGPHLHFEIYENNKPINPLEVLPIKIEDIKYDTATLQKTATISTSATSTSN